MNSTYLQYRPGIDGLRAVAVLSVLLYHAQLGVPGGFVGVDVFFVISGFLITSIILKDAASPGGFSIVRFWERRIRRIVPALLVVLAAVVIMGWFVLLPSAFLRLGRSLMAQAAFAGNFYFWLTGGYFGAPSAHKPLLHTWSLAVEEQYYLVFPLLFVLGRKWKLSALKWIVAIAAISSLAWNIYLTHVRQDEAFYLLPTRAWELFLGALLAMSPPQRGAPGWVAEIVGWAGFLGLAFAFRFFNDDTAFPGRAAILPCAGAAAILWSNEAAARPPSLIRLLSLRPMVGVGQISYSLYLWHWPVLVYAMQFNDVGVFRWYERAGLLVLSAVLAFASWQFVEKPFRSRDLLPGRKAIFAFGMAVPACCAVVGAAINFGHGVPSRFSEAVIRCDVAIDEDAVLYTSEADRKRVMEKDQFKRFGSLDAPVQCLVWGDSHARAILPALEPYVADSSSALEGAVYNATPPILDFNDHVSNGMRENSAAWKQAVLDHVRRKHIPNVLLAARWNWYPTWEGPAAHSALTSEMKAKLAATTAALRDAGARVWILKEVPRQTTEVAKVLARAVWHGRSTDIGVTKQAYLEASRVEDEILAPSVAAGATILDPAPLFFDGRTTCLVISNGYPLFLDGDHLAREGAQMLTGVFAPIWNKPISPIHPH